MQYQIRKCIVFVMWIRHAVVETQMSNGKNEQ
jgi:hypothetical protein